MSLVFRGVRQRLVLPEKGNLDPVGGTISSRRVFLLLPLLLSRGRGFLGGSSVVTRGGEEIVRTVSGHGRILVVITILETAEGGRGLPPHPDLHGHAGLLGGGSLVRVVEGEGVVPLDAHLGGYLLRGHGGLRGVRTLLLPLAADDQPQQQVPPVLRKPCTQQQQQQQQTNKQTKQSQQWHKSKEPIVLAIIDPKINNSTITFEGQYLREKRSLPPHPSRS